MPTYEFTCEVTGVTLDVEMHREEVVPIGEWTECVCDDGGYRPHSMRRVVGSVSIAEVPGTANNKIGAALEKRAKIGRRRSAEHDRLRREGMRDGQ